MVSGPLPSLRGSIAAGSGAPFAARRGLATDTASDSACRAGPAEGIVSRMLRPLFLAPLLCYCLLPWGPIEGRAAKRSERFYAALVTLAGKEVQVLHASSEDSLRGARALLERRESAARRMGPRWRA